MFKKLFGKKRLFRKMLAPAIAAVTWVQSGNSVSATPLKWKIGVTNMPKGINYLSPKEVCKKCGKKNTNSTLRALRTLLGDQDICGWNGRKDKKFKVKWDILNTKEVARCLLTDSDELPIFAIKGENSIRIQLTPQELAEGVFANKIEIPEYFWSFNSLYKGRDTFKEAYEERLEDLQDDLDIIISQYKNQKKEVT